MQHVNRFGLFFIGLVLSMAGGANESDVVTVVSARSPVLSLSKIQVAAIFLGKSNRFPDGEQATPIDQPESSSIRESFYNQVAGQSLAQVKAHWSKIIFTGRGQPPRTVLNGDEVKKFLSENPLAISYIEENQVDSTVRVLRAP